MGSAKKAVEKIGESVGNAAVKVTTGGSLSLDGSGWAEKIAKGEELSAMDLASGVGGATIEGAQALTTKPMPEIPEAEDPVAQARRAAAEADKKTMEQIGEKGRGLSSTILGGSLSKDEGVLKKRKLLGE